jgi:hypothetical protein
LQVNAVFDSNKNLLDTLFNDVDVSAGFLLKWSCDAF